MSLFVVHVMGLQSEEAITIKHGTLIVCIAIGVESEQLFSTKHSMQFHFLDTCLFYENEDAKVRSHFLICYHCLICLYQKMFISVMAVTEFLMISTSC